MSKSDSSNPRRRFIARAAAAIAALGFPVAALAESTLRRGEEFEGDGWMKPLKGQHRQIFDATAPEDTPMRFASNFLDAYADAFAAKPGEANAAIGLHGSAIWIGFSDAAWKKYSLGKIADIQDRGTTAPAVRNVFRTEPRTGVETLQQRGVAFIMCNNALRNRARIIASQRNESFDAVYDDLKSLMLPGVTLVPAMVVAVNRAQEAGFSYIRA